MIGRTIGPRRVTTLIAVALATLVGRWSSPTPSSSPDWTVRLQSLDPSTPLAYLELAEEVADQASDEANLQLARHLFGLAGLLDTPGLGRSVCLALADLAAESHERERLLAMASLLGQARGATDFAPARSTERFSVDTALAVSKAFGYYRQGDGSRALAALRSPGAMDLLKSIDHLVRGGTRRFTDECKRYVGLNRPPVTPAHRAMMLRTELALLSAEDRSWSGELLLTGGRPLIELDPEQLGELLGVDVSRAIFRDGSWVGVDDQP